jgi:hypothetical protein
MNVAPSGIKPTETCKSITQDNATSSNQVTVPAPHFSLDKSSGKKTMQ